MHRWLKLTRARAVGRRSAVVPAVIVVAALTGCVQVPTGNSPTTSAPPQSLEEQLLAMEEADHQSMSGGEEDLPLAFLSADRNAYCVIGPKQGNHFENPVNPLMAAGEKDDTKLQVTAVYCEFATYPEPEKVTDDCYGTNLGFKGGTMMLTAKGAVYGGCRVGVTVMESEFGPGAKTADGPVASLPVLREDYAVEAGGYRCGDNGGGMICLELENGLGFQVSEDEFKILGKTPTK